MSSCTLLPCHHILLEHFGESVQKIGSCILSHSSLPLRLICERTDTQPNLVGLSNIAQCQLLRYARKPSSGSSLDNIGTYCYGIDMLLRATSAFYQYNFVLG